MAAYDGIAEQYKKRMVNPIHVYLRQYTFFTLIGDLTNQSILDLACGDGFYTRKFKLNNSGRVVGVDISAKVIEFAKQEEARAPLGIEYMVCDVLELSQIGSFDLVTAIQLLHYAQTKEQLLKMCQNIYAHVKNGGRFVTINGNFDLDVIFQGHKKIEKYGLPKAQFPDSPQEGAMIPVTFTTVEGQQAHFSVYYFSRATYQWALHTAGFKVVRWHQPIVSPEGIEQFGKEFWQDALDCPIDWYIECIK